MPRRIVVTAEASKLFSRKVRWSAYKRQVCKWLIDTLQLELHAYEIAGQLEGQCVFTSTYCGAQVTGLVCTFDDKISACVTSIRFDDGDGWRPKGGPRKSNFAGLEIISGSSIRGDGRYWEIEQDYGDDIGAPGPLNGKLSGPMRLSSLQENAVSTEAVGDENSRREEASSSAQFPSDLAARLTSIRQLLDMLLAALGHLRVLHGDSVSREQAAKRNVLAQQVSSCRAVLLKWFDASKGYGFTAHSSRTPAPALRVGRASSARVFISYRRADAASVGDQYGVGPLGLPERGLMSEIVEQVKDVECAWIETAGSHCDVPEALHLLSVLATDASTLLARDAGRTGDERPIDEASCCLLGSVAADVAGAGIGHAAHGPPVH